MQLCHWRSEEDIRTAVRFRLDENLVALAEALREKALDVCGDADGVVGLLRYDAHGLNFTAAIGEGDRRRVIITTA